MGIFSIWNWEWNFFSEIHSAPLAPPPVFALGTTLNSFQVWIYQLGDSKIMINMEFKANIKKNNTLTFICIFYIKV